MTARRHGTVGALGVLCIVGTVACTSARAPDGACGGEPLTRPSPPPLSTDAIRAGDAVVTGAFVRPLSDSSAAMYVSIDNRGFRTIDRLRCVSSTVAASSTLLGAPTCDNATAAAQPVAGIDIPADALVVLKIGGCHIRLAELTQPLLPGTEIQVELVFERSGPLQLEVPVKAAS